MANNKISLFFKSLLLGIFISGFGVNGHAATLPDGYTELQYIESTGTQYIDTGYKMTSDVVEYGVEVYGVPSAGQSLFGSQVSSSPRFSGVAYNGSSGCQLYIGTTSGANTSVFTAGVWNTYIVRTTSSTSGTVTLNGSDTAFTYSDGIQKTQNIYLFANNGANASVRELFSGQIRHFWIKDNNILVRNLIPAKNSSNVIGMYDTVNGQFYTNQGTGTFTAGPEVLNPCRNLFDMQIEQGNIGNDGANTSSSARVRTAGYISVSPNTTYTLSVDIDDYTGSSSGGVFLRFYNVSSGDFAEHYLTGDGWHDPRGGYTFTTPAGAYGLRIIFAKSGTYTTITPSQISNIQLERGSTATTYTPYDASCHNTNSIKIATTAYNSARFSPVVNDLNTTIATIRSVVTNTINQTKAIADLQATKQTRPDENCPAGKKCLLVETEENGIVVPHWYEIIESASRLPDGYIERQYIYMMNNSYLLPNITPEADWHIEMDFQTTSVTTAGVRNYFGSRYVNAPTGAGIRLAHTGAGYVVLYGFDTANPYTGNSYKMQSNTRYKYVYNNNSASLSTGGTVVDSTTFTVNDTTTREVAINNYSSSDTWGTTTEGIYLYSFKVWNGQGELVMDLVPAKNSSDVVGFYDTVSGAFKTATAGTFTAGPEIQ